MGYQLARRAHSLYLTPEEVVVQRALSVYCFEPTMCDFRDWCATEALWDTYRRYVKDNRVPGNLILKRNQFGVALRRCFDIPPNRREKHRYQGRLVWGYRYVQGPGARQIRQQAGRPKRDSD